MRYFFIDLENVKSEGLEGVLSLGSDDNVIIFYSENAMNLTIPALENLNNSKASKKFIKTNYIGKNAMDFQIVSLFGAMIERNKQGSYYIISQDNGFRSAVSFCESYFESYHPMCGVHPTIIAAITDEMKKSVGKAKPAPQQKAKQQPDKPKAQPQQKPSVNNQEPAQESTTEESVQESAAETTVQPKKKRRRKKKTTGEAVQGNDVLNGTGEGDETPEDTTETPDDTEDGANEGAAAETDTADTAAPAEPAVNRLGYIYDTLGELLSAKTIDIYAATIDEGIARCANRDELHEFFRSRYGDDEGEALYKVMQSDFEAMKQARPKKASRTHRRGRHRSKKSTGNTAEKSE